MDLPKWVQVVDYGVRGMHLAYDLAAVSYELTIMVDATSGATKPAPST